MLEVIALVLFFIFILLILKINPPNQSFIFLGLAAVVSLVGINIDLGVTIRLSRVFLFLFLITFLLNWNYFKKLKISDSIYPFFILFTLIIVNQIISSLMSDHLQSGISQIFIYINLMFLFLAILLTSGNIEIIKRGIKIYILVGLIQAAYGFYQIFAGPLGLATYQSLFASMGIPMTNDQTVDGYLYSGALGLFRTTGFFSADVSHYAGYLVGIITISLSMLFHNPKRKYLWLIFIMAIFALILSFSRSGQLALILFGLPVLLFLLIHFKLIFFRVRNIFNLKIASVFTVFIFSLPFIANQVGFDIDQVATTISSRFTDLFDAGSNDKESMGIHILTRLQGLDAFFTHPFFGVGLGVNASPWYSDFYGGYAGSHSHHIDILAQTGIIGALLEWFFMFTVLRIMWRGLSTPIKDLEAHFILAGIFASVIAIIGGNLFYHYYINDFVWFLMATGTALSFYIINQNLENMKNTE